MKEISLPSARNLAPKACGISDWRLLRIHFVIGHRSRLRSAPYFAPQQLFSTLSVCIRLQRFLKCALSLSCRKRIYHQWRATGGLMSRELVLGAVWEGIRHIFPDLVTYVWTTPPGMLSLRGREKSRPVKLRFRA